MEHAPLIGYVFAVLVIIYLILKVIYKQK